MSTHANRVKMTVTSVASSGTGDITLNAASSGFRSFATAYGANATVDILITEGTAWEIARNCTYTHSGTTVSRGTLENSSTGSAVAFTADAVVSVIATAAFGNNAVLNHVAASPTTAGVTGVVGTMHLLDISGLTASRNFTLPATAAVGDRVGVYITTGDDTYALIIIGDTGDTINGGSAATEWTRLFNANDSIVLRCVTADSAWVVENVVWVDNIFKASANGSTTQNMPRNAVTKLTTALATEVSDADALWDTTNKQMVARRAGLYTFNFATQIDNVQSGKSTQALLYVDGSSVAGGPFYPIGVAGAPVSTSAATLQLATGAVVDLRVYYEEATTDRNTSVAASNNFISGIRIGG